MGTKRNNHWYTTTPVQEGERPTLVRPPCAACGSTRGRGDGRFVLAQGPAFPYPRSVPLCGTCLALVVTRSGGGGKLLPSLVYQLLDHPSALLPGG